MRSQVLFHFTGPSPRRIKRPASSCQPAGTPLAMARTLSFCRRPGPAVSPFWCKFRKHQKGETEMEKNVITHQDLRQFTGDLTRYSHWKNRRVIYTPGIKYLAGQAQAYWLVDAIASYFGSQEMIRASLRDIRLFLFRVRLPSFRCPKDKLHTSPIEC